MQPAPSRTQKCAATQFGNKAECRNAALEGQAFCRYHLGPLTLENACERVIEFTSDEMGFYFEEVSEQSRLEDLYVDSLGIVEITMRLEEELGLEIPDEEVDNLQSVGDLVNFVTAHLLKEGLGPTIKAASEEGRKGDRTERRLKRIARSEQFREYYEALDLDEEEMERLFRAVIGNGRIYHVTPAIVYRDEEKKEAWCVHLFLLGRRDLFYFKLMSEQVKFEWSALKDLRLTYEVALGGDGKISKIRVMSSLAASLHDPSYPVAGTTEVRCDSEESLHNLAFTFEGKEINGALRFLGKFLNNLGEEDE